MPRNTQEIPSQALATFDIQQGPLATTRIAIPAPVVTIGQSAQNDVVIPDDSVSRTHAKLEYDAGGWHVTDLGSTNGSFLNGDRLEPNVATPLPYGANIRFGAILARFRPVDSVDLDAARARYVPPRPAVPLAERGASGFRFPLWAFVLLILIVALLYYFFVYRAAPLAVALQPAPLFAALAGPFAQAS